ncbi:hypothetical protein LTR37_009061 [Vermiconidia calcicola]|uniref:Uncharacterized protein n=1 Tax=Vermiconidia calcicola TaxID=1690605 RepID=A0ACC3N8Z7_9PEZI|nr:hypothetical protein LTR37_009061 [Vermiconidia calcicola]
MIRKHLSKIIVAAAAADVVDPTPTLSQRASSNGNSFDMSGMRSALDAAPTSTKSNGATPGKPTRGAGKREVPIPDESTGYQQDVGYAGEVFVYEWLKKNFSMPFTGWTSGLRSEHGIEPFDGIESDYVDFTIGEPVISEKITRWLISVGKSEVEIYRGEHVTYHFEVKTTVGRCDEPFSMSNNQVALAREWHDSASDVFVILRVYNLTSGPKIRPYVDPYELRQSGALSFTAQGGYYVEIN